MKELGFLEYVNLALGKTLYKETGMTITRFFLCVSVVAHSAVSLFFHILLAGSRKPQQQLDVRSPLSLAGSYKVEPLAPQSTKRVLPSLVCAAGFGPLHLCWLSETHVINFTQVVPSPLLSFCPCWSSLTTAQPPVTWLVKWR